MLEKFRANVLKPAENLNYSLCRQETRNRFFALMKYLFL